MVSSKVYTGDGTTKVFPVDFEILGEDYVQIWLDDIAVNDRTTYDIINNSIVFLDSYIPASGVRIDIAVATTAQEIGDLNAPPSGIEIVSENIDDINLIADNIDKVLDNAKLIDARTSIYYGDGEPPANLNPINVEHAIYVDNITKKSWICYDATTDANVWIPNGTGQFIDLGTSFGSGIMFTAQKSGVEDIVIPSGVNACSIDNFELEDGATLTIEDGATYKVI